MNRSFIPQFALFLLLGFSDAAFAQTVVKQVPPKPTVAIDGKDLYRQYCAACHGIDGKGAGPAAPALKKAPTDLTRIAASNHGSFPDDRIMRILRGEEAITAHGSTSMPVWGTVFSNMSPSVEMAQLRLHALVNYLDKLQVK